MRRRGAGHGLEGIVIGKLLSQHDDAVLHQGRLVADGRAVTVKLPAGDMTLEWRERLEHELLLLARFEGHPGIVSRRDPGPIQNAQHCLILEAVTPMQNAIPPVTPAGVADVLGAGVVAAGALETMHRDGYVHRDVCVDSILRTTYGEVRLAHLASARRLGKDAVGLDGIALPYAAPEVCAGQQASSRSDLYSLAATLYALFTGSPPFGDPASDPSGLAAGLLRIRADSVPRVHVAGVPADVSELLARAMAKSPADRPASALDLGRELQDLQRRHRYAVTPCFVPGEPAVDDTPASFAGRSKAAGARPEGPGPRVDPIDEPPVRRSSGPRIVDAPQPRGRRSVLPAQPFSEAAPAAVAAQRPAPPVQAAGVLGAQSPETPPGIPNPSLPPPAPAPMAGDVVRRPQRAASPSSSRRPPGDVALPPTGAGLRLVWVLALVVVCVSVALLATLFLLRR